MKLPSPYLKVVLCDPHSRVVSNYDWQLTGFDVDYRPGDRLHSFIYFVVFLSSSTEIVRQYLKIFLLFIIITLTAIGLSPGGSGTR
jgi:hypothetical protein